MKFDYELLRICTQSLTLEYFLVPWDTQVLGAPVANIDRFEIKDAAQATDDYRSFIEWCRKQKIALCNCRLSQDDMIESMFLQERGFRFIELNYHPHLDGLEARNFSEDKLVVECANEDDQSALVEMAGSVFQSGRFHQDPRIGPAAGNHRYQMWMKNSFDHPRQKVMKCLDEEKIVGFFVVEYPRKGHCLLVLCGLAPGLGARGLGKRVWSAMLKWQRTQG